MECLDEKTLGGLFERDDSEAVAAAEAHARECPACRKLLAERAPRRMTAPFDSGILDRAADRRSPAPLASAVPTPDGDEASRVHLGRRVARAVAEQRVGTTLSGRWRIDRLIDTGGMAQVYAATHRNGRPVAVKVLRPELAVEPELVQRFLREGYVANKVQHPGAVAILDDDVAPDGAPFLVMELLDGRTLRSRLVDDGPLPVEEALRVTEEVLAVLASAHERGIVHRDIKPENLFETKDGAIKVLDFGIARLRELVLGAADADGSVNPSTESGRTMGTIGYMAPEQARGEPAEVDARSDLWAVGATLYTLLTGRVLHDAPTTNAGLLLAMTVPVAPMQELAPELPGAVRAVLDTALAFDKTSRYADSGAMGAAVRAARAGASPRPPASAEAVPVAAPSLEAGGRPRLLVAGLITACIALGVVALLLRGDDRPAPAVGLVGSAEVAPRSTPSAISNDPTVPELPVTNAADLPRAAPTPRVTAHPEPPRAAPPPSPRPMVDASVAPRVTPVSAGPARPPTPPPASLDPLGPRR